MKKYYPIDFDEKGKAILGEARNTPTSNSFIPTTWTPGGGGDARFSTCEVEISFTSNGQPLTLDDAEVTLFNGYSASPIPAFNESNNTYYQCYPLLDQDHTTMTPLLFEGAAYTNGASGMSGGTPYLSTFDVAPVCTGDISMGTFNDMPVVIIRGSGTITFEMMAD